LKKYKSPGSDEILEELIQAGGETLLSAIHKLINSVWNKEELPDQWKEPIIVPVHKKGDNTDCNNHRGIANHRLQESLCFSEEGSIVQYSHRVWGTHETSQVD
jgi:hypothetical protein